MSREQSDVYIVKENGERERFDVTKLERSLERAGASSEAVSAVVNRIREELRDGMTTSYIYRHAHALLDEREEETAASRYSLKRAIFALGPTGFPFERYVERIFAASGYQVESGEIVDGYCVEHEVDVLGQTPDQEGVVGEVKFHNKQGTKTDVQTALYVSARFDDIDAKRKDDDDGAFAERWLITNTKFTDDAIAYGECASLNMIGWNYPHQGSLQTFIEETGIHPVTCLSALTDKDIKRILKHDIVVCRDLSHERDTLLAAGIDEERVERLIAQSKHLCDAPHHVYNAA
jgi:hypothetical protein